MRYSPVVSLQTPEDEEIEIVTLEELRHPSMREEVASHPESETPNIALAVHQEEPQTLHQGQTELRTVLVEPCDEAFVFEEVHELQEELTPVPGPARSIQFGEKFLETLREEHLTRRLGRRGLRSCSGPLCRVSFRLWGADPGRATCRRRGIAGLRHPLTSVFSSSSSNEFLSGGFRCLERCRRICETRRASVFRSGTAGKGGEEISPVRMKKGGERSSVDSSNNKRLLEFSLLQSVKGQGSVGLTVFLYSQRF